MAPTVTQVSINTMAAATAELALRTGLTDSEEEGEEPNVSNCQEE